jgi:hypothetical protein
MKTAQAQNIFHGGVGQDKYAGARVRAASDQPVMVSGLPRTPLPDTTNPRSKKHSRQRRLSQLATWVEDPIVFKIRQKARKKNLSMSKTIRRLLIKALKDGDEAMDEALDPEMVAGQMARANSRLASRLTWFLVRLVFDVGNIKVLAANTLGLQRGMTETMLKDILHDADRRTKGSLSRKNPELTAFMDEVEQWLRAEEHGAEREEGRG